MSDQDLTDSVTPRPIAWKNVRVKLGDLQPWEHNPRQMTQKQAERLLASWRDFGQVETVAVSPALDVYDGHQRLSALLTVHGAGYEIDARQSSRALTDDERRRLVLALHAGAVGSWNWDALSGWDETLLVSVFDTDALKSINLDAAAIRELLGSDINPYQEWAEQGMPEHINPNAPTNQVTIHFTSEDGRKRLEELMGIDLQKRFVFWPNKLVNDKSRVYVDA